MIGSSKACFTGMSTGIMMLPIIALTVPVSIMAQQPDDPLVPTFTPTATPYPTFIPTTTWSPTVTQFPTISAFPTFEVCNVCGRDRTMTAFDDILVLEALNTTNVTCQEANDAGFSGQIPLKSCEFLLLYVADNDKCGCELPPGATLSPTFSPTAVASYPVCDICSDLGVVTNQDASIQLGNETFTCRFLEEAGKAGVWEPDLCDLWQNVSVTTCECAEVTRAPLASGDTFPPTSTIEEEVDDCYICGGPNYKFLNPDEKVVVPFELTGIFTEILGGTVEESLVCANLEEVQSVKLWSPLVCSFLELKAGPVCGCLEIPSVAPAKNPVTDANVPVAAPAVPTSMALLNNWNNSLILAGLIWILL